MERSSQAFKVVLALWVTPVILKHFLHIVTIKLVITVFRKHAGPVKKVRFHDSTVQELD